MTLEGGDAALLIRGARVATPAGAGASALLRGEAVGRLDVHARADVLVAGDRIAAVGPDLSPPPGAGRVDADGHVLVPGFVDAHTHACWAGERLGEWEARMAGATYSELLAAGGGILATVRAVREASEEELADALVRRLDWALREGTTTIEVKSGYGLDTATELRMLRAIRAVAGRWPGHVVATACLGHAKDPEVASFVDRVVEETLPAVHEAFPGVAVDAYCEEGAWSVAECVRLFEAAAALGHPVRVHADQFRSLGMVAEAIRLGAASVDHLEATPPETLRALASSPVAGFLLPVSGFHLDGRYADGRTFVDAGGAPVVATNWNPGSAPSPSVAFALGLAVRHNGLTPAEALTAATHNAATLLGLADRGRIEVGARADLVLLRHRDERELAHTVGGSPVRLVVCGGLVVHDPERIADGVAANGHGRPREGVS